jgi:L-fuculose-phosphate aldolase
MPASDGEALREAGRMLWESGLVSSHGGNLSARLADGGILITRTGAMLGRLGEGDLATVTADGSSAGAPSMDAAVHRAIYEATGAGAVVHAHPRHAIALSLVLDALEPADAEGKLRLSVVPVVDGEGVAEALRTAAVALARGHGSYARGEDVWQALQWTSVLEESAQVLWLLRSLRL